MSPFGSCGQPPIFLSLSSFIHQLPTTIAIDFSTDRTSNDRATGSFISKVSTNGFWKVWTISRVIWRNAQPGQCKEEGAEAAAGQRIERNFVDFHRFHGFKSYRRRRAIHLVSRIQISSSSFVYRSHGELKLLVFECEDAHN